MFGWLFSQALLSVAGAGLIVWIYKTATHDILGPAANAVKTSVFVGTWTVITTVTGMRALSALVRRLRHGSQEVGSQIDKRLQ